MQDEAEAIVLRRALVLEDHPSVGVLRARVCVLTADEREAYGTRIVVGRRRDGPANAAAIALFVDEPVPVDTGRLESRGEYAARPIGRLAEIGLRGCDDASEVFVLGDLDREAFRRVAVHRRAPRPQQHAIGVRVA